MAAPNIIQEMASELATANQYLFATRALTLAGFVVLLYDHFLTLGDEIRLIWLKPPSIISTLFLINRYAVPIIISIDIFVIGGLARNLTDSLCRGWLFCEGYLQILSFAIAHALLALRVRAIWAQSRISVGLAIAFTIYLASTLLIGTMAGIASLPTWRWNSIFNTCFGDRNRWATWVWVPALVLETILFCLTLLKGHRYTREVFSMPLTRLLYRDGTLYFLVIALCSIANLISWSVLPPMLSYLTKFFSFSIVATMSSRLVLNLRAIGREDEAWVTELSVLQFELRPTSWHLSGVHPASPRSRESEDAYTAIAPLGSVSVRKKRLTRDSAAGKWGTRRSSNGLIHPARVTEVQSHPLSR